MSSNQFICADWGTSNLRLYLCQVNDSNAASASILDTRTGPGVSQMQSEFERAFEQYFFDLVGDWLSATGPIPIILSGMVGSSLGWIEAPYIQCPANIENMVDNRISFASRGFEISIISGLKASNPLGNTDLMRGEELQLLGWMQRNTASPGMIKEKANAQASKFVVLPGTHNKWVRLRNGVVETFLTALTGEMFAIVKNHSILITDKNTQHFDQAAFLQGLSIVKKAAAGGGNLLHTLFSVRSNQVLQELPAAKATSYLSGMLIGADVIGALSVFTTISALTLIGEFALCERYSLVLNSFDINATIEDPAEITLAGFTAIYKHLYLEQTTKKTTN